MRKKDQDVIRAFVAHLGEGVDGGLRVDRWPDLEDRTGKAIDAIAGRYAIEHTSIDALDAKRSRDPPFMTAVGELERAERSGPLPPAHRLAISDSSQGPRLAGNARRPL